MNAQSIAKKSVGKKKKAAPANEIVFVLDCSGSMHSYWAAVTKLLKDNLQTIRGESIKTGQDTNITMYVFGDTVRRVVARCPIQDFKLPDMHPSMGMTALYTATLDATSYINDVEKDASVVVLVFTDGEDNRSGPIQAGRLKQLITQCQNTDRYSFAFMVPPGHEGTITSRLGLPAGNVVAWEQTIEGAKKAGVMMTSGLQHYYAVRSTGGTSTKGFFTTDMSKVKAKDVKSSLQDIRKQVKVLTVPKETTIKDFVEEELGEYRLGAAYYELTKDEVIHGYKDILVMERDKKEVWAGPQVRDLLNIPDKDIKVRPGNHANWRIFPQSTSVNRRLVRGSKLIVVVA